MNVEVEEKERRHRGRYGWWEIGLTKGGGDEGREGGRLREDQYSGK